MASFGFGAPCWVHEGTSRVAVGANCETRTYRFNAGLEHSSPPAGLLRFVMEDLPAFRSLYAETHAGNVELRPRVNQCKCLDKISGVNECSNSEEKGGKEKAPFFGLIVSSITGIPVDLPRARP